LDFGIGEVAEMELAGTLPEHRERLLHLDGEESSGKADSYRETAIIARKVMKARFEGQAVSGRADKGDLADGFGERGDDDRWRDRPPSRAGGAPIMAITSWPPSWAVGVT